MSTSGAMIGLGLLTGDASFASSFGALPSIETKAQRKAKAAFTIAPTTPPWRDPKIETQTDSAKLAAVKSLRSVVDTPSSLDLAVSKDVSTTFVAFKALDRLKTLAERAADKTTGTAEREGLQKLFVKGMTDLKTFLGSAPTEQVELAFGKSTRYAQSVAIAGASSLTAPTINGKPVIKERAGALEGLTGNEKFQVKLSNPNGTVDTLTVDLSTAPQPPTLDGVADAINAKIKSVPRTDAKGVIQRDENGDPIPRWSVKFEPVKFAEKWGLSVKRAGFETVSIDEIGGKDAVMVASGVSTPVIGKDGKSTAGAIETRVTRINDPAGDMTRQTLNNFSATDRVATERAALIAEGAGTKAATVNASIKTQAMVTDAAGNSYLVGTSSGDLGGNRADGQDDMVLTKLDSEGNMLWQRTLGSPGAASGAAISLAPDGGVVVAASVSGAFTEAAKDGTTAVLQSDGDMLVARFDAMGEETSSTLVRQFGADQATAVAVGANGAIYLGGRSATAGGDAYVARIGTDGKVAERRTINSGGNDTVRALAIAGDGKLLALTGEAGTAILRRLDGAALATDVAKLNLGTLDARALAVAADGQIAVGGARSTGGANGRDGFVARIDSNLTAAGMTAIATTGDDQVDSLSFLGDKLYVGGRTSGTLGEEKTGTVDAFVTRIDRATGTISSTEQFGARAYSAEPVQISAIAGGDSVLGKLGLSRGTLTPTDAISLKAQTTLRAGDEFSLKVNGGRAVKITIGDKDTLATLADKIKKIVSTRVANVSTPFKDSERSLRFDLKPGQSIELVAGPANRDALAKLGFEARRISAPAILDDDAPKVRPGGSFGLDLVDGLRLDTKGEAAGALKRVEQAISYTQSAYRSLYWDDTKAQLAEEGPKNGKRGGSTAVQQAQLANYTAALTRLSSGSTGIVGL